MRRIAREGDSATASLSKEMTLRMKAQERGLLMLVEAAPAPCAR
jgi:hypothetical protein